MSHQLSEFLFCECKYVAYHKIKAGFMAVDKLYMRRN